jgi:hypothetical protein
MNYEDIKTHVVKVWIKLSNLKMDQLKRHNNHADMLECLNAKKEQGNGIFFNRIVIFKTFSRFFTGCQCHNNRDLFKALEYFYKISNQQFSIPWEPLSELEAFLSNIFHQ